MLIGETEAREDRRWAMRAGKFLWELAQTVVLTLSRVEVLKSSCQ